MSGDATNGYDATLPDPDEFLRKKGHRLRLSFDGECFVDIIEERVWPERIDRPGASPLEVTDRIILLRDGARWLRDQLTIVLERMGES